MKPFVLASLALASPALAQQLPPVRPLGATVAASTESFGSITGVRELPGGHVLVNDPVHRRVLMFDSTLATPRVVADSTSATANAYSGRIGGLIPYRGDSTLFVDPGSVSMLVIDPGGKLGRVMSMPRTQDAMFLVGGAFGAPGFDGAGRLVYRASNFEMRGLRRNADGSPSMPEFPDSAPVVRVNLATRVLDTAAFIRVPKVKMRMSQDANGRFTASSEINPLPLVDEWAVLPDGSIAIVRGRDYHVEFIAPDGAKRSSAKLPFEWQRLSDEDKSAFIDSVKAVRERMAAAGGPPASGSPTIVMRGGATPPAGASGAGGEQRVMIMGGPPPAGGRGAPAGAPQVELHFVDPSELPDYKPAFLAGALRADLDGNLWIRTVPTRVIAGGPVYDIVNARGELTERVQIPANRAIVGFGAGGVVYLMAHEKDVVTLERARVR